MNEARASEPVNLESPCKPVDGTRTIMYKEALRRNDDTISDLVLMDLISSGHSAQRKVIERLVQATVDVTEERIRESFKTAGLL